MELMELSKDEISLLNTCEIKIETGLHTFKEVGNALLIVRDNKLFRHTYNTFEEYCQDRWNISKSYGTRLIQASNVINNLLPLGNSEIIDSERKTRILSKYEPEIQRLIVSDLDKEGIKNLTASYLEGFAKAYVLANDKIKEVKKQPPLFSFNSENELLDYAKQFIKPEIQTIPDIQEQARLNRSISDLNKKNVEVSQKNAFLIEENTELKTKVQEVEQIRQALVNINDLEKKKNSLISESEKAFEIKEALKEATDFFNSKVLYLANIQPTEFIKKAMISELNNFLNSIESFQDVIINKFF